MWKDHANIKNKIVHLIPKDQDINTKSKETCAQEKLILNIDTITYLKNN